MKFLSVPEAAEHLRVSPSTVERMLTRGELAGYRLPSGTLRLKEHDLEDFIAACRIKAANQPKENAS